MSKKKDDIHKMTIIINIQVMWDKIGITHNESDLKEMLKMTYDQLWEKQMDVKYLYNEHLKNKACQ